MKASNKLSSEAMKLAEVLFPLIVAVPSLIKKTNFLNTCYLKPIESRYPKSEAIHPVMQPHRKLNEGQKVSQEMYTKAFELINAHDGTPYPCSQSETNFHNSGKFIHRNKGPFVSAIEATAEVVRHNNETRRIPPLESAAIDRLIDAILDAEENGYAPDIIVKAFSDLDLVFFGGRLRGNVCVQWASDAYFQQWHAPTGTWGFTVRPQPGEFGQCRVKLNAKTILQDASTDTPFKTMFGTVLHEMCHAYEHVRCYPQECDQRDGHDKHFRTKIHAVHRRAYPLLGLWAIDRREPYRKDHFMSQEWSREWRDMKCEQREHCRNESQHGEGAERSSKAKVGKSKKSRGKVEGECVMM